jgi:hypothetical protein
MSQQFIITGNIEFLGDLNLLIGGRIEAYDRPILDEVLSMHQILRK